MKKNIFELISVGLFISISSLCVFAASDNMEMDEVFRLKHIVSETNKVVYDKVILEKENEIIANMLAFLHKDAVSYYRRNKFDEAIMILNEIMLIDSQYKKVSFFAEGLKEIIKQGGTSKARKEVIEQYYERGLDFYTQGNLMGAIECWQRALVLSPGYKDCKNLIKRAKKHLIEVYYQEGLNFYKDRKYELALARWYIVSEINPDYSDVLELIEIAKEEVYKQNVDGLYNKGISLYKAGQKEQALKVFKKLLSLAPDHKQAIAKKKEIENELASYYFNKGKGYFDKGNFKEAIEYFKKALYFNPTSARIIDYLSKAREEQALLAIKPKSKKESLPLSVEPAFKEAPPPQEEPVQSRKLTQSEIEAAERHYITGLYYYQNGFLEEAISEWESVLRINPMHEKTVTSIRKAKEELRRLRK